MQIKDYVGLQFFEGSFMVVLGLLPYIVFQKYVAMFLVAMVVLYVLLRVIRRSNVEKIAIHGQGVLITGCDTGFGHHLARRLDRSGFTVYAGCLDEHGDGAGTLRTSDTGRMHVLPLDVTSDTSVNSCLDYVTKMCGDNGLWALVNNAGIDFLGHVEFSTMEMYKRVAEVNQFGVVRVTKAFLPLIRREKGRVLNVTSVNGRFNLQFKSVYNMTKWAVESFSDILRLEMLKFGVKVVVIEPGNYGGITEVLGDRFMDGCQRDIATMLTSAGPDVRDCYGQDSLEEMRKNVQDPKKRLRPPSVDPVIDAMENAITLVNPQYRYLVHEGNTFLDKFCVLAILNSYLPGSWMTYLINKVV
ncbi:hypothetical protein ScPMuIL_003741 [Solemya velum]